MCRWLHVDWARSKAKYSLSLHVSVLHWRKKKRNVFNNNKIYPERKLSINCSNEDFYQMLTFLDDTIGDMRILL